MKRIASLIFVFLMMGLPLVMAQDAEFDDMAQMMEMDPEMAAAAGGIMAIMAGMGLVVFLVSLVFMVFIMICQWKVLNKTGRPGPLALLNLVGFGIVPLIMNCIDMKKINRGVGSILGMIFIPIIMYPIIAFSKKGAPAPVLEGDDGLSFDDEPETAAQGVANRMMARTDVAARNRAGEGDFSGATAFTIFALLGLLMFIGVVVLQTMEILYLDGTMDNGNSIWPPKP